MDYVATHAAVGRRTRAREEAFFRTEWERRKGQPAASRRAAAAAAETAEAERRKRGRGPRGGGVSSRDSGSGSKRGGGGGGDGEREVNEEAEGEVPLVRKRRRREVRFSDEPEESGREEENENENVDNVRREGIEENVEKGRADSEDNVISISSKESSETESETEFETESFDSSGNEDTDLDGDYIALDGSGSDTVGGGSGDDDELDSDFSSSDSEREYASRMRYQAGRRVPRLDVFTDDITGEQFERKKISGLDVWVNTDTNNVIGSGSVAQRTRSHRVSTFSAKMRRKMGMGTVSSPIRCDDEDIGLTDEDDSTSSSGYDSYSDDDDDDYEMEPGAAEEGGTTTMGEDGIKVPARKVRTSSMRKEHGKRRRRKKRIIGDAENERTSRIRKEKSDSSIKTKSSIARKKTIIAHGKKNKKKGLLEAGEEESTEKRVRKERRKREKDKCGRRIKYPAPLYNLLSREVDGVVQRETENRHDVPPFPLDYIFEIEEPLEEKTDYEKQLEPLWAEFDFALKSVELVSFNSSAIDNENAHKSNVKGDVATICQQGEHDLILDEEIGYKCTLCSFVKLEIKHVIPSMDAYSSERISRRYCSDAANIFWDGSHFEEGVSESLSPELKGTIWERFPNIRKKMYKHQQEGFEFMWRNLAGSINLEELNNPNVSEGVGGCVISHAPGTGKTFLAIAFMQTFMSVFEDCRPVIMAPCSMLLTWEEEFKKWNVNIPFHNLNAKEFSGKEDGSILQLVGGGNSCSVESIRLVKLLSWTKGKSVLGVSYSLFEKQAGQKVVKDREGREKEVPRDKIGENIRKTLLEKPSLLVLDEGHTPRNEKSRIWQALRNIKTERRIILSGTPFQNNFYELYNTLWLVRPKFANRISSTKKVRHAPSNLLSEKEAKGKWASLTNSIGKGSESMLLEIRSIIEPFVHVHKGAILQNLPGLRDCVIGLHLTELQKELLEEAKGMKKQLELEHLVSVVTIHPSLFLTCKPHRIQKHFYDKIASETFKLDPSNGVKTRFLMELIKLSDTLNEKVLVFSQYIHPFSLIKDQLHQHFNWSEGVEVQQMDGKLNMENRQSLIKSFNDPSSKVRVLLASIKACREGISLIGASRVVLLDVVWNPSVVRQAISRAFRIGQNKIVYTYHLITSGTEERQKYCRQVQKSRLSKLVFTCSQGHVNEQNSSSVISGDKILETMIGNENLKDMFDKIEIITKTVDID
ncbi:hypothetical protein Scep_026446 [Stephania cephalantha]|uniref:Uncharacterized protein n=1 Tax=Stephania cephalantha TaxID=152367 RepID=A0AAP0HS27_9MAGN